LSDRASGPLLVPGDFELSGIAVLRPSGVHMQAIAKHKATAVYVSVISGFRAKYFVKSFQEFAANVFSRDPDMHFVTSF